MAELGYIQARAYTSRARIPLEDVSVIITDPDNRLIAMRLTDESGIIAPVSLEVPDFSDSQQPETGETPFATVNLYAKLEQYEQIEIKNLQVFAQTVTLQELAMIPLSELPLNREKVEIFNTPPQNL